MAKTIALRNTKQTYGLVAIALHWIVAAGFIVNYALIYYREWFVSGRSAEGRTLLFLHGAIGVSVLVFVILRIIWRLMNQPPTDVPGSRLEHVSAHAMHTALYAVMLIMPLTGYLGNRSGADLFFLVELPPFAETAMFTTVFEGWMGLSWEQFEAPMDFIHKRGGAFLVWVLVALHAVAALYHHFIRKDIVLRRMLSPRLPDDEAGKETLRSA